MTPVQAVQNLLAWLATFVRESPAASNAGSWVEAIQRWAGGWKGDAWCAALVYVVGSFGCAAVGKRWPLPRTTRCQALYDYAKAHALIAETPSVGDVYLLLDDAGRAHHAGFVTDLPTDLTFDETSGNTSDPTKPPSREGWGVFPHRRATVRTKYVFVHWQEAA